MSRAAFIALLFAATPALGQDPTQIAAVRDGARACVGCNLFQADFAYQTLRGRDLSRARLRQANLSVATLDASYLRNTDLTLANAFGARLSGADLRGADLSGAVLTGAYLGGARLEGAVLKDAQLAGADLSTARGLTQAQLGEACGDDGTRLPSNLSIPTC